MATRWQAAEDACSDWHSYIGRLPSAQAAYVRMSCCCSTMILHLSCVGSTRPSSSAMAGHSALGSALPLPPSARLHSKLRQFWYGSGKHRPRSPKRTYPPLRSELQLAAFSLLRNGWCPGSAVFTVSCFLAVMETSDFRHF